MSENTNIYGWAASGGGAKGAWGGGVSQYLVNDLGRNYKYYAASSTGSLLMSLVAANKFEDLKTAYTSVNNDSIYTICPYRITQNNNGIFKTKMNYLRIGYNMLIRGKKTFGDSSRLREELLPKFFTREDYERVKESNVELVACVTNLTLGKTEFKSSYNDLITYEDFLDWVFASTCAAPFMSIVEKDGYEYADGGYIEHVPIQPLIDRGCTIIDVISLKSPSLDAEFIRNPIHLVNRLIDIMMWETAEIDMELASLKASEKDVTINLYRPQRRLTNNSLVFDKESMKAWWIEGYEYASMQCHEQWCISKRKKPKKIETTKE